MQMPDIHEKFAGAFLDAMPTGPAAFAKRYEAVNPTSVAGCPNFDTGRAARARIAPPRRIRPPRPHAIDGGSGPLTRSAKLEDRHGAHQRGRLIGQAVCSGGHLFDERCVLLRHFVHLHDRLSHLADARALLCSAQRMGFAKA